MTESALWEKWNKLMGDAWKGRRHEDILAKGVPDVSYSVSPTLSGWTELKCDFSFQKGILKIKSLTADQRVWLYGQNKYNGHCFVLAANEKIWIFIKGSLVLKQEWKIEELSWREPKHVTRDWVLNVLEGRIGY